MGTRADFYIGTGVTAKWLGSVAWDGNEWIDKDNVLAKAKTEQEFTDAVKSIGSKRDDFTSPDKGWPWPWTDSRTTDYAYCYTESGMKVFCFGHPIIEGENNYDEDAPNYIEHPEAEFPDMKSIQKVDFGARSGVMIISA